MAFLAPYHTAAQYMEDALTFLKNYQWLYNFRNSDILVNKVTEHFPLDWISYLEQLTNKDLNDFILCKTTEDIPSSLKEFINTLDSLKPKVKCFDECDDTDDIKYPKNTRIGNKKMHEIKAFAPLIKYVCGKTHVGVVIDVGAGLGYLSQLLFEKYHYKVIGIEGSKINVLRAEENQLMFYKNSVGSVKYIEHYIKKTSGENIKSIMQDTFFSNNMCIVGLHACADLSVTIIDIFLEMDCAKSLVIMPCCYHRLEMKHADSGEHFVNFPISKTLKGIFKKLEGEHFLKRYFLRLACQQSSSALHILSEDQHIILGENCLFRAVLQVVAEEENWNISRLKRKSGKSQNSDHFNIDQMIKNVNSTHAFTSNDEKETKIDAVVLQQKVLKKWSKHRKELKLIESILAFQSALQGVCENIVLLDRIEYLKEKGVQSYVCKVTDDCLSPRCFAIVASK